MRKLLIRTLENGAKVWSYGKMQGGDKDVDKTVWLMKKYAFDDKNDDAIMKIANEIKANNTTDLEKIKAAYMYVVEHIRYIEDGSDEFVASPRHSLTWLGQGDCDCMTTAIFTLLLALGYTKMYAKVIAWKEDETGENEFTHVYSMALIPDMNIVIPLDAVMEKKGFGNEKQPVKRIKIYRIA